MSAPTQATIFDAFMCATWEQGDGAPDYDIFYDAVMVASAMGARPGPIRESPAGRGADWLFPDGSSAFIIQDPDNIGTGVISQ